MWVSWHCCAVAIQHLSRGTCAFRMQPPDEHPRLCTRTTAGSQPRRPFFTPNTYGPSAAPVTKLPADSSGTHGAWLLETRGDARMRPPKLYMCLHRLKHRSSIPSDTHVVPLLRGNHLSETTCLRLFVQDYLPKTVRLRLLV